MILTDTLRRRGLLVSVLAAAAGLQLVAAPLVQKPALDYDGDGRSDFVVLRPNTSNGTLTWYMQGAGGVASVAFGLSSDIPVNGDFDGDGKSDPAVWRPGALGTFYVFSSLSGVQTTSFGTTGDDPTVVADYDGDGKTDLAVYRPGATAGAPSTWVIRRSSDGVIISPTWGIRGDVAAPGDYDGDGRWDLAIRRPNGARATLWASRSSAGSWIVDAGLATDLYVPADYDCDGATDIGVVRADNGRLLWLIVAALTQSFYSVTHGASATDVPVPADYNGDGCTDVAVWRTTPSAGGSGFLVRSWTAPMTYTPFGSPGDLTMTGALSHATPVAPPAIVFNDDFNGAALFPSDNWWNQSVLNAPVDTQSASFISFIGATRGLHPDFGPPPYGIPYYSVGGAQARVPVNFIWWPGESDSGFGGVLGYPIPEQAKTTAGYIEGNVAGGGTSGDRHMIIVDRDRRLLFELYATRWNASAQQWQAGSGAIFDLNANGRRTEGWTSADAAGLAILPGLVRYEEAMSGREITHAFRVTVRDTNGYVWPASHAAGSNASALPMGARLRLKASKDLSGYTPYIRRIFRAMQVYGLIVADNGSDMYISGAMDSRWNNDQLNPAFSSLKASDFEVVQRGWR